MGLRAALLLAACGAAPVADANADADALPEARWQAAATLVLAADRFDGLHAARPATAAWLRRAEVEAAWRHAAWRAQAGASRGSNGRWAFDEARLGLEVSAPGHGWAVSAGRFDPAFGIEPDSGHRASPAPEASPLWDLAPQADDGDEAAGLAWRGWRDDGVSAHAGVQRDAAGWQANGRIARAQSGWLLAASAAWRPEVADTGPLRTRLAVRGSSEHPAGQRLRLLPALPPGHDTTLALSAARLRGAGLVQAEWLLRRIGDAAGARSASGLMLHLAWSPGRPSRRIDDREGRLRLSAWTGAGVLTHFVRGAALRAGAGRATHLQTGLEWRPLPALRLLAAAGLARGRDDTGTPVSTGRHLALRLSWEPRT